MKSVGESKTIKIESLQLWEKNPRSISEKDFERLKKQIKKLGQYKPLLINQDNIVLGGNMRLRALQDLGVTEVWVNQVNTETEDQMVEYALSDNDRAGEYDELGLAELLNDSKIELDMYKVDLNPATNLDDLSTNTEPKEPKVKQVKCPECGHEFEV